MTATTRSHPMFGVFVTPTAADHPAEVAPAVREAVRATRQQS